MQIRIWNTVSSKMKTLICEILKKELYSTYSRGSRPTPDICTLGVRIRHADDPKKNFIFIHRLLFCSKPEHKIIVLLLSMSVPNGTSISWHKDQIFTIFIGLLEVSTRKPIMVFYYKTTKGFVSRTVWENRLRPNFETFITFSEH